MQQQTPQPPQQGPPDPSQPPPQQIRKQQLMQQSCRTASSRSEDASEKPTIEQVLQVPQDNRAKAFVLDIETDSTIMADENAEKQRRTEFVGVLGAAAAAAGADDRGRAADRAEFCGEVLKFATAPFRAGRSLDGAIDELVEQMKAKAGSRRATTRRRRRTRPHCRSSR